MQPSLNHKVPTFSLDFGEAWSPFDHVLYSAGDPSSPSSNSQQVARSLDPGESTRSELRRHKPSTHPNNNATLEDYRQDPYDQSEPNGFSSNFDRAFFDEELTEADAHPKYRSEQTERDRLEFNPTDSEFDGYEAEDFESDHLVDRYIEQELEPYSSRSSKRAGRSRFEQAYDNDLEALDEDWNIETYANHGPPRAGVTSKSSQVKRPLKRLLEQGQIQSLEATSSAEYLQRLSQVLRQAIAALAERSSRSPSALQSQLVLLQLLVQRYGDRGLSEQAVFEDAVKLYAQTSPAELRPLVTGLTVRLLLKSQLEKGSPPTALHQQLLSAIGDLVKVLVQRRQVKALPGLVARVGQRARQEQRPAHQLPQLLHQAIAQMGQSPALYQRLCHFSGEKAPAQVSSATAQGLRVDGPVEIFIRTREGWPEQA